jgi:hypothetical protein
VLENYGIIEVYNFTDTHKMAYVQRLYDGKVIEDLAYAVRPRNILRLRFPPGYYHLAATLEDGRTLQTSKPVLLQACEVEHLVMKYKKPESPEDKPIRPRRISGIFQTEVHTRRPGWRECFTAPSDLLLAHWGSAV